jgi:2-desacetyl-2-hydroxyethyl bacteriochlorophyllide A dehydrogenase
VEQLVYAGPNHVEVQAARDIVEPKPDEVIVEVAYTGICGTDLHIYAGHMHERVAPGTVLGHEMSGRVAAVGSAVTDWAPGDAATVMPLDWCGECAACLAGHWHICQRLSFIGIDVSGSMRRWWAVAPRTLIRIPETIPLRDAALLEPTAVAVHDVHRARVQAGDRVLVVGCGPVGTLIAAVARQRGAEVVAIETDSFRRGLVASLGFTVLDPALTDVVSYMENWTNGAGADVAFEVSSSQAGLATAVKCLSVRGNLCVVAIHNESPSVDLHRVFWRELTMVGARLYNRRDFEEAVALMAAGAIPTDALISKVFPISDAPSAFAALRAKESVMKVIVDCGGN